MRWIREVSSVAILAGAVVWACHATTPTGVATAEAAPARTESKPTSTTKAKTKPKAPAPKRVKTTPSKATPSKVSSAPEPTEPAACPEGMVLVEGEYCSKVEQHCLKSWYDKSNKKTVCEEFEPVSRCVGTRTKKRFCIDRYAWPNKAGERPEVMNRFNQAEVKCAAVGKRLCTESEWTMACEGPEMKPFPYGYVRDTNICHGDVMWDSPNMSKVAARDPEELARLWKGVRSGSQPRCVSDYGVYDLPGNTDEVVSSETFSSDFRGKFDSVHTGGPWYKGVRNQCRPKIYTHDEGFYYYYLSFRCCAEPDGKPTDPRTVKQRKWKWSFDRVERIAGFTRKDVQDALTLKRKQGNCGCKPNDIRCKTICGTLLGADAKDFPKPSPKDKPSGKASQDGPKGGS